MGNFYKHIKWHILDFFSLKTAKIVCLSSSEFTAYSCINGTDEIIQTEHWKHINDKDANGIQCTLKTAKYNVNIILEIGQNFEMTLFANCKGTIAGILIFSSAQIWCRGAGPRGHFHLMSRLISGTTCTQNINQTFR